MKPARLIEAACEVCGVTVADIMQGRCNTDATVAKRVATVLLRKSGMPLEKIAMQFGCTHHTTVLYSLRASKRSTICADYVAKAEAELGIE